MYATEADATRWLSSTTDPKDQPLPPFAADRAKTSETRQRKRQKLGGRRHKIPSPPTSEPVPNAAMPSSSRKRTRTDDHDSYDGSSSAHSDGRNNEITPRPGRFQQLELVPFSADRGTNSPSRSSASTQLVSASNQSRHGTVSNKSSPSKQFRNAEMKETGFYVGSFSRQPHPESLRAPRIELRDIGLGNGILPTSLEIELRSLGSEIPRFAFDKDEATGANTEETATNLPPFSRVKRLVDRAVECQNDREGEASWNADVHAPVLEQVFRSDRFGSQGMVDFRYCPSAQILPAYKPRDAPSHMADFCLFIRPECGSPEKQAIKAICHSRSGQSIIHTDLGNFCEHPIALSIETKRPGEQGDNAMLQMGTWHSAQWRSLRRRRTIEFLPGLIVQGHAWQFVASILDKSGKSLLSETVPLGRTDTEIGVYSLVVALLRLSRWIVEEYWPAFVEDMLVV